MAKFQQPHGGTLNRYEKGTTGNPKGRPKGSRNKKNIVIEVFEYLDKTPPQSISEVQKDYPKLTTLDLMIAVQINKAITKQDTQAFKVIMELIQPTLSQVQIINDSEEELKDEITRLLSIIGFADISKPVPGL